MKIREHSKIGGYPILYIVDENEILCAKCAKNIDQNEQTIFRNINWENSDLYCDECGKKIECAY